MWLQSHGGCGWRNPKTRLGWVSTTAALQAGGGCPMLAGSSAVAVVNWSAETWPFLGAWASYSIAAGFQEAEAAALLKAWLRSPRTSLLLHHNDQSQS